MASTHHPSGQYLLCGPSAERYRAFVPAPLPPVPPINLIGLQDLLAKANQILGKLNGIAAFVPNWHLLLYFYIRKEAVLSSQIEGTQSSLSDLLLCENGAVPSVPTGDVIEVVSYIAALEHGQRRMLEGFPLSLRLIREVLEVFLSKGRGCEKQPGEFRRSQNWIGGTRPGNAVFVPPPSDHLMACLDAFEKYLHLKQRPYPSLIDAGLIHAQFETIHPFLDGNGRIGRLLILFFLMMKGDLEYPILYLSLFFKNNRSAYYQHLNDIRENSHWEAWLQFFLNSIIETADQVIKTSQAVMTLFKEDATKIEVLKRVGLNTMKGYQVLQKKALISAKNLASSLGVSIITARTVLNRLKQLGIVRAVKGSGKEQCYLYSNFLRLLEEST